MKALTVQQPWAWAIIYGGKDVENRTQMWGHRGPLAIHAGARWSWRGADSPLVSDAITGDDAVDRILNVRGALIGVVDLVDVHVSVDGCCDSPWAETLYEEHGGRTRRNLVHLVLENPRPLPEPIPWKGRLGLWDLPNSVLPPYPSRMPCE